MNCQSIRELVEVSLRGIDEAAFKSIADELQNVKAMKSIPGKKGIKPRLTESPGGDMPVPDDFTTVVVNAKV